jgi:hypothetical protein
MANVMTSFVEVKNINKEVKDYILQFCDVDEESKYYNTTVRVLDLVNDLYDTEFTEDDWWTVDWGYDNLGSKWMEFDWITIDDDSIEFNLQTAWSVPQRFFETLGQKLGSIHRDCYLLGSYEDESYEPMGAFVYDLYYDDIEDLDEEIDHDRMWEEDDYLESLHDKVDELKQDIERAYLDDLQNRIDNPSDYE